MLYMDVKCMENIWSAQLLFTYRQILHLYNKRAFAMSGYNILFNIEYFIVCILLKEH